ncbi:hypothetical protein RIF29_28020 [Crotalaria pallida]|uniref:Uncharacterized protein n=1 Tax=Crotalaria pallida TaxID=3830 RepID=A0AAN9ER48_CROPI
MHVNEDWFTKGLHMVLRNGEKATTPLKQSFPRLFTCCMDQNIKVGEAGTWENGSWAWNFPWRRRLFAWEEDLVEELRVSVLNSFHELEGYDHQFGRGATNGLTYHGKAADTWAVGITLYLASITYTVAADSLSDFANQDRRYHHRCQPYRRTIADVEKKPRVVLFLLTATLVDRAALRLPWLAPPLFASPVACPALAVTAAAAVHNSTLPCVQLLQTTFRT